MTKSDIVESISNEIAVTKKDITYILDSFFEKIKTGLLNDEHIELRRFGTFGTKTRQARTARNPKTSKKVNVPAHQTPYFKAGKELKEWVVNKKI